MRPVRHGQASYLLEMANTLITVYETYRFGFVVFAADEESVRPPSENMVRNAFTRCTQQYQFNLIEYYRA